MATTQIASHFTALNGENFMSLTTYRKDGSAKATPVWFAEKDGKLYVFTQADSWKVKRLRDNSNVIVAASDARGNVHGESIEGKGTVHEMDSPTGKIGNAALNKKYHIQILFFKFIYWISRNKAVILEITAT